MRAPPGPRGDHSPFASEKALTYPFYNGTPPHSGSATSWNAATQIQAYAGTLRTQVFQAIWQSAAGLTQDDVEVATGLKHQTVSPRLRELEMKGLIVDSGYTRKTRSGRDAVIWIPATPGVTGALPVYKKRPARATIQSAISTLTALYQANPSAFSPDLIEVVMWLQRMSARRPGTRRHP